MLAASAAARNDSNVNHLLHRGSNAGHALGARRRPDVESLPSGAQACRALDVHRPRVFIGRAKYGLTCSAFTAPTRRGGLHRWQSHNRRYSPRRPNGRQPYAGASPGSNLMLYARERPCTTGRAQVGRGTPRSRTHAARTSQSSLHERILNSPAPAPPNARVSPQTSPIKARA